MSEKFVKAFNKKLAEFICELRVVYPDDAKLLLIQKTLAESFSENPSKVINGWEQLVTSRYKSQIDAGNADFFLAVSYENDIREIRQAVETRNTASQFQEHLIRDTIEHLRNVMRTMEPALKASSMTTVATLTRVTTQWKNTLEAR